MLTLFDAFVLNSSMAVNSGKGYQQLDMFSFISITSKFGELQIFLNDIHIKCKFVKIQLNDNSHGLHHYI